jgi:hypothetical protein
MANAAARVLELFLEKPKRGVTGVTLVTGRSVTPESQAVTTVTPVTHEPRKFQENDVTSSHSYHSGETSIRYEERAAIIEYEGAVPRSRAEIMARLDPTNPPVGVPMARWQQFIDDCGRFFDSGWVNRAEALGWGPLDLFGCDRERPLARYDHMGLLWIIQGRRLVALTADTATIDTLTGSLQTYRRVPINLDRALLAWGLPS